MSKVQRGSDNVETQHDRIITTTAGYVEALRSQWFDLSREDRREAARVLADCAVSLHTLGVRP